jgi:hypothetical protein
MGTGRAWRALSASMLGAVVLHMAVAAVALGDSAALSNPAAGVPMAVSMQVRPFATGFADTKHSTLAAGEHKELHPPVVAVPTGSNTPPASGRRYFDTSEVDAPAMPLPEWQVDVPMLMGLGVRSVSVDVLISEAGVAQQCAITRIEPPQPPALQLEVAARLCETVLRPAQRRGVAVASVRHIELVLASD